MRLNNEQIRSLALGVAETLSNQDGIELYRMKIAQAERIRNFNSNYGKRAYTTAGIRLDFYTDSTFFAFAYDNTKSSTPCCGYYFTLLINGKEAALIGEDQATACAGAYRMELPEGKKHITLFLPDLFRTRITSVELSDGSFFERVNPKHRFVFHGDSITHGASAKSPANAYTNCVAYALDAEVFNFAIAGARFDMRMIDTSSDYNADAVFVAYGTNDWNNREDMPTFSKFCSEFFKTLIPLHKNVPVFVILPIWRSDCQKERPVGTFEDARKEIARIASGYENTRIIDLAEDIPQDLAFFTDGLHPNDDGFACYTQGLLNKIKL